MTPTTVYLPFNRDCLRGEFEPAKHGGPPPAPRGHWLLVQEQKLVVVPEGGGFRLPTGELPTSLLIARRSQMQHDHRDHVGFGHA